MKFLSNGTELYATWKEPTSNTDGSALNDLHHTSIFYDDGTGPVNVVDLPASLNTGGGDMNYSFIVPVLDNEVKDIQVWGTATNNAGKTSAPSPVTTVHVSRLTPETISFLSVS